MRGLMQVVRTPVDTSVHISLKNCTSIAEEVVVGWLGYIYSLLFCHFHFLFSQN